MRWKLVLVGLALGLAATVGCERQCFLKEPDYNHYHYLNIPELECNAAASVTPTAPIDVPAPATVVNPERKIRYMTLAEALSLALENGTTGLQSVQFPGAIQDNLVSFAGTSVVGSDSIRALALDPAILGTNMEASLAKFDARWVTSMAWTTLDQPIGSAIQSFQATGTAASAIQTQDATFSTTLLKPLPTGGVTGITFRTDYEFTNLNARVNPAYRPDLQFVFDQPLLQGFGVEINQLRTTLPGSTPGIPGLVPPAGLLPFFPVGGRVEGILITRLRFDQQRAELERNVNFLLVNAEITYWNLYGAYWTLYSREQGLRQAYESWRLSDIRFKAGRIAIQDYALTRQQYESFRAQRITALGDLLERERQLRGILGLAIEDGCRIVPVDAPTLAAYRPDWHASLNDAIALRPELILAREDLKFRQLDLINQKNLLLPDLRFVSTYDINGLGNHLGGGPNDPQNALASLASDRFNNWSIALRMDVPLGFRDAHAAVRQARLNLGRSYAVLQDQERKAKRYLEFQYHNVFQFYELIQAQRALRQAAALQVRARFDRFFAGTETLEFLLQAQQAWADALRDEYAAIVNYNNSLAGFEFAKGTIQQHDNVVVAEGPLPNCAQVRMVEHERQRAASLVLRERAAAVPQGCCNYEQGQLGLPELPANGAPPVPSMFPDENKLAPGSPEEAPTPRPLPGNKPEDVPAPLPKGVTESRLNLTAGPDLANATIVDPALQRASYRPAGAAVRNADDGSAPVSDAGCWKRAPGKMPATADQPSATNVVPVSWKGTGKPAPAGQAPADAEGPALGFSEGPILPSR